MLLKTKFLFWFCLALPLALYAQIDYLDDQPGVLFNAKKPQVPGFPSYEIYQIFNRIPFISQPVGHDSREGTFIELDKRFNVYHGYMGLGLPRYYRFREQIVTQGEYYHIVITTNHYDALALSTILNKETDRLHHEEFISDTAAIEYKMINGAMVGKAQTVPQYWQSREIYVLNPRQKAFFIPVTTEEYINFFIQKLGLDIGEAKKNIESSQQSLEYQKSYNAKESDIRYTEKTQQVEKNELDFYERKLKEYQDRAAHLTDKEKKQPVTVMYPETFRRLDKQYNPVSPITGYMPYEIYSPEAKTATLIKLYHYNPEFFDHRLPKTAVQVMIFFYLNGYEQRDPFETRVRNEVFPYVNFKALSDVMYH